MVIMAIRCLVLLLITARALSQSLDFQKFLNAYGEGSNPKVAAKLSKPLLTDDGRIYACSGKNLFSFDTNGIVAWIAPLGYLCSAEISPVVDDRGKIYLIAEDKILKITPLNIGTSKSTSIVIFGLNSTIGGSEGIIGLSISIMYASLFITIKNRGLFALSFHGELLWSAGPILYQFGFRQGCKENLKDCYFNSAPILDQCEGTIYIFNTEGQVYSIHMRSYHFRWVQDFSFIDKYMAIIAGNNGFLYVIFPKRASLIALDVYSGNISWQHNFGPLSAEQSLPVVDSNGWLSVGSLDGYLYSFSPIGEAKKLLGATASNSVIQAGPVLDCSGFAVYILQTKMTTKLSHNIRNDSYISAMDPTGIVLTMLAPATGTIYWTKSYLGEVTNLFSSSDLRYFTLDERILLTFLSSSRTGNSLPCHTMSQRNSWTCSQAKPKFNMHTGDEGAILPFILFQLAVLVLLSFCVHFCFVFRRKKKLQIHGLAKFLDRRRTLHRKWKSLGRLISKLEQSAVEDLNADEALEQLGEVVKAKAGIERKLSTSYSLSRDSVSFRRGSMLPFFDGKANSHSFRRATNESVTIFGALSLSDSSERESKDKGKAVVDETSSSKSTLEEGLSFDSK